MTIFFFSIRMNSRCFVPDFFFSNTATIFTRSWVHAWAFCLGCTDIYSVAACQLVALAIGYIYSVNMGLLLKY